jgi:tyrosinase
MMAVGDDRGWHYWAGIHGLPLPMYCQHHTPLFLPWHRAYLYFAELALKQAGNDPGLSLPWWDWTSQASHTTGVPEAYTADQADGVPNPLTGNDFPDIVRQQGRLPAQVTRTFREPGADPHAPSLPTAAGVQALLGLGDFQDFQQQLEQFHDDVHVWVGGTMAEIPVAAYDPLFWAHHTMVDRIWRLWQLAHPAAGVPAELLDEALPPFNITVRQTLSVTALGYDYAAFTVRSGSTP